MKPINKKHRKAAIVKFVLVYLLTIIVLVAPVYAVFKIPKKQCDINENTISKLEKDYEKCRKERDKLNNKTNLSMEDENELEKIYSDYLQTFAEVNENVRAIDAVINSPNDIWNEDQIETIKDANNAIYESRNEINRINAMFDTLLNKK